MDPYKYYDVDLVMVNSNLDPYRKKSQELKRTKEYVIVKAGWESAIKKKKLILKRLTTWIFR